MLLSRNFRTSALAVLGTPIPQLLIRRVLLTKRAIVALQASEAGSPRILHSNPFHFLVCSCPPVASFWDSGWREVLQDVGVYLVIPKVGDERLQHPERIHHVPLLRCILQVELLGGGVLLEGEPVTPDRVDMLRREVGLQGNELVDGARLDVLACPVRGLFGSGTVVAAVARHPCLSLQGKRNGECYVMIPRSPSPTTPPARSPLALG
jgi:hypothetical protein